MGSSGGSQLLAFIKVDLSVQVDELVSYFQSKGAEIDTENAAETKLFDNMKHVISVCNSCFADSTDAEIESVLNSIVSIITVESIDGHEELIKHFSSKLAACETHQHVCLKVIKLLFNSLKKTSVSRYDVYHSLLSVAGKVNQIDSVFTSATEISTILGEHVTMSQRQTLLRLVYRELLVNKKSEAASRVMVDLLSTYTEETASQAVEEARSCVVAALIDPDILLLDYLTALKPVKQLAGTPLHQLLSIFVSGTLTDYLELYGKHQSLFESLGLNHEHSVIKMQQLTFLQLSQSHQIMTFEFLQKNLQLEHDEAVEQFLINVIRTRMVRARMDQVGKCVHVSYTTPRTFGTEQWSQLREVLVGWRSRVDSTKHNLLTVVNAQNNVIGV